MASLFDLLIAQQTGQPMPDDPLSALLASTQMPQQPQPGIPPFIDLRAQRPPQPPAPGFLDFLRGLLPGTPMTDQQMAAVPGAVPPAVPPGMTAPLPQMPSAPPPLEQSQPLGPALASAIQALVPPPSAPAPVQGPLPMVRPAPASAVPLPPAPTPAPVAFGLPQAPVGAPATRSMTISPTGQIGQTGGGDQIDRYAAAIKSIESDGSGGYSAIGATHPKLGRALGAYQVMEANVGPWTEEILGKKMTAEEFLRDPAAQDAVFKGKFGQYLKERGNPQDAASMWFTGKPAAEGASKKDVHGTTGNAYVDKFNAALNQVGNAMPGAPRITSPNLPIPGPTEALKGLDPSVFAAIQALQPTAMTPLSTGEKITGVLGAMAAGAKGANNIGDLLLGAGAGAGRGASENIMLERGELAKFNQAKDALARLSAETEVRKGEAAQQGQNYQIAARNRDKDLLNQVATEQAKLDTAAKNKMAEIENQIDWKKWEYFQPQVTTDKDGITVVARKPDGSLLVNSTKLSDMKTQVDQIEQAAKLYGKDSASVDAIRYAALAQRGEPWVRMQIMRDMVEGNHVASVLGEEQFKKLQQEAQKGVDPALRGKPEEFDKQVKERMLGLLWSQKIPDQNWLPYMLKQGNFGAALLARPGV